MNNDKKTRSITGLSRLPRGKELCSNLQSIFATARPYTVLTDQRDDEGEEPGIDEEVVSASFDDVDEGGGDGQSDQLHHYKLLGLILEEETQSLKQRKRLDSVFLGLICLFVGLQICQHEK